MNQNKLIFLIISSVAVFLIFYFAIWSPNIGKIQKTQKEINKKRMELAQLKKDVESWPKTATREKLEEYEERLKYLFSLVPSKEEVPGLLDRIQEHGLSSANLQFLSLTKSTKSADNKVNASENDYFRDAYVLTVNGSYFAIVKFIYELEQAERLININNISFIGQNNTAQYSSYSPNARTFKTRPGDVEATITLSIFYTGAPPDF